MTRLVVASNNAGKLRELSGILAPLGPQLGDDAGEQREVGAGEHGEADGVGVVVQHPAERAALAPFLQPRADLGRIKVSAVADVLGTELAGDMAGVGLFLDPIKAGRVLPTLPRPDARLFEQAAKNANSVKYNELEKSLRNGSFDTVLGKMSFDAKGNSKAPAFVVYQWKDGKYDYVK